MQHTGAQSATLTDFELAQQLHNEEVRSSIKMELVFVVAFLGFVLCFDLFVFVLFCACSQMFLRANAARCDALKDNIFTLFQ